MTLQSLMQEEALKFLLNQQRGVLAYIGSDGDLYQFPVDFYFDGEYIWAHMLEGDATRALRANPQCSLFTENVQDSYHWCNALARGEYIEITDERHRERVLAELFHRFPQLTSVESEMSEGLYQCVVYSIKVGHITGRKEEW